MLELQQIRNETEMVVRKLEQRKFQDAAHTINKIIQTDLDRRTTQQQLDENLAKSNGLSKEIGMLFKQGKKEEAEKIKKETSDLKSNAKVLQETLNQKENELTELLLSVPNIPDDLVKPGSGEEDNEIVEEHGTIPTLTANKQPHWELIKTFNIIDFDLGVKITGAGFPVYKGKGARLQRGLINFFLDRARETGYTEIQPPIVVNEASGLATGQLPDKEGQMYEIHAEGYYLIPTAEVPITNIYRDLIIPEEKLPIKNAGYTPCFRREAGSWGADVRGLNRLHQFDKVEIIQITTPEKSKEALEGMMKHVASLLNELELPYRVLRLCSGDLGFTSSITYDFEVYSAAQEKWLEVSSVSNFKTYQSNRLKVRYKKEGKTQLLHTLNGSALALPRIVAALLENNQKEEGIFMPKTLIPYVGFESITINDVI